MLTLRLREPCFVLKRDLGRHFKAPGLTLEIIGASGLLLLVRVDGGERDHAADAVDDALGREAVEEGAQGR